MKTKIKFASTNLNTMVKLFMVTFFIAIAGFIFKPLQASPPQGISYQAVIRDNNGQLVTEQQVGLRITLLHGNQMDSIAYQETQTVNTNANGLVSLVIGDGNISHGVFEEIVWEKGPYFLQTETDPQGGTNYSISNTSKLLSVPYALSSQSASKISLPFNQAYEKDGPIFSISNTKNEGLSWTIISRLNSHSGSAVVGSALNTQGVNNGVWGESHSPEGFGVVGVGMASEGNSIGVYGSTNSVDGYSGYFTGPRFYISGNLGLGIAVPAERLHVDGNIRLTGGERSIINATTGGGGLSLGTQGLVRMRIASNGNVGIGTTSPEEKLHIVGNIVFSGVDATIINSTPGGNGLGFGTQGQVRMRIASNGNVGLGTTSPEEKLHIVGNIMFSGVDATIINSTPGGNGLGLGTQGQIRMRIASNGSVGIGTISPTQRLHVVGNAYKTEGGTAWATSSDLRLKKVTGSYAKGLAEILALNPVTYHYLENNPKDLPHQIEQTGFIAQEVKQIFPEAVWEGEDGYLEFSIHAVNIALVNAIKELKVENDILREEAEQLKTLNSSLTHSVNEIYLRLQKIESNLSTEIVEAK